MAFAYFTINLLIDPTNIPFSFGGQNALLSCVSIGIWNLEGVVTIGLPPNLLFIFLNGHNLFILNRLYQIN